MIVKNDIKDIRKGDSFKVNGEILIAQYAANQNFDEEDAPWIVYDTDDNSWFEEDIEK